SSPWQRRAFGSMSEHPRTPKPIHPLQTRPTIAATEPERGGDGLECCARDEPGAAEAHPGDARAMAGLRGRFAPEVQRCCATATTTGGEGRDAAAGSGDPAGMRNEERQTLPRHLHRAVLRLLRPAEAAARRLIIVTARDLVVTPQ